MPYDAKPKKNPFIKSKAPASLYERALRSIAREVGRLTKGYIEEDPLDIQKADTLIRALNQYSELIGPWALRICNNLLKQLDDQDKYSWRLHTTEMGKALRDELLNAPTGDTVNEILKQNVLLIKSIPTEAAQRINKLIQENMVQSRRSSEIAEMIMNTEGVAKSRATLIARTEVSKAQVALTRARAQSVGSEGYIWRTAGDMVVRKSHRKMNGVYCKWDEPPLINEGSDKKPNMIAHGPGEIWNCRCWPFPVLPEG